MQAILEAKDVTKSAPRKELVGNCSSLSAGAHTVLWTEEKNWTPSYHAAI